MVGERGRAEFKFLDALVQRRRQAPANPRSEVTEARGESSHPPLRFLAAPMDSIIEVQRQMELMKDILARYRHLPFRQDLPVALGCEEECHCQSHFT